MSDVTTLTAAALLLLLPGPTNALIAAATATGGARRLAGGTLAVIAAYALVLILLGLASDALAAELPAITPALKIAAAVLLALSAVKLWRTEASAGVAVPTHRIFVITLVNPKALVLAFVLMPPGLPSPTLAAGLVAVIAAVTALWGGIGLVVGRLGRRHAASGTLNRVAATLLGAVSATVLVTAVVSPL